MTEINVMSWNVSWEAMSSKDGPTVKGTKCVGQCLKNVEEKINEAIKNYNVSIIGTQETSLLNTKNFMPNNKYWIPKALTTPSAMISYTNIYNDITKQKLGVDIVQGNLNELNGARGIRAYQMIVLQEKTTQNEILFINLHREYDSDVQRDLNHMDKILNGKIFKYIIVTGDFNTELLKIKNQLTISRNELKINTLKRNTCCDNNLNGDLSTYGKVVNILTFGFDVIKVIDLFEGQDHQFHSDHLPVLVKLKFTRAGAPLAPAPAPAPAPKPILILIPPAPRPSAPTSLPNNWKKLPPNEIIKLLAEKSYEINKKGITDYSLYYQLKNFLSLKLNSKLSNTSLKNG
jgi:hypothetical protein